MTLVNEFRDSLKTAVSNLNSNVRPLLKSMNTNNVVNVKKVLIGRGGKLTLVYEDLISHLRGLRKVLLSKVVYKEILNDIIIVKNFTEDVAGTIGTEKEKISLLENLDEVIISLQSLEEFIKHLR